MKDIEVQFHDDRTVEQTAHFAGGLAQTYRDRPLTIGTWYAHSREILDSLFLDCLRALFPSLPADDARNRSVQGKEEIMLVARLR